MASSRHGLPRWVQGSSVGEEASRKEKRYEVICNKAALEQEAGRAFQVLNGGGLSPPPGVDLSSP